MKMSFLILLEFRYGRVINFIEDEIIHWENIIEHAQDRFPELDGQWDEEEGNWKTEEAEDFWSDVQWEFYHDLLDDIEQETREILN